MIQVDVFWSFGLGAGFASMASHELASNPQHPYLNRFFMWTVLFLGLLFNPSGVYLLNAFPYWESMFVFTAVTDMHPMLPTLFSCTNVLLGMIGYEMARRSIRAEGVFACHKWWVGAYAIMFAILGFGYQRFTYPGDAEDWRAGRQFPLTDFFFCDVFQTLLVMGVILLPSVYIPMIRWPGETGMTKRDKHHHMQQILRDLGACVVLGCSGFLAYRFFLATDVQLLDMADGPLGTFAPVAGFLTAILVLFPLVMVPWAFVHTAD